MTKSKTFRLADADRTLLAQVSADSKRTERQRRNAAILLYYESGATQAETAAQYIVDEDTVRRLVARYKKNGARAAITMDEQGFALKRKYSVHLKPHEKQKLRKLIDDKSISPTTHKRAHVLLLVDAGNSYSYIEQAAKTKMVRHIVRWYCTDGLSRVLNAVEKS